MKGFLLLAPTGSGKSHMVKSDPFFQKWACDGDDLIDWSLIDWTKTDWVLQDRKHLDIILEKLRADTICVCWYVGNDGDRDSKPSHAIQGAIEDGQLPKDRVAVLLLDEVEHRKWIDERKKKGESKTSWSIAERHRHHLEQLYAFQLEVARILLRSPRLPIILP